MLGYPCSHVSEWGQSRKLESIPNYLHLPTELNKTYGNETQMEGPIAWNIRKQMRKIGDRKQERRGITDNPSEPGC